MEIEGKRINRFVTIDSSPQGGWDYFMVHEVDMEHDEMGMVKLGDPLGGFRWHRRMLPVTCLGARDTGTVQKTCKLMHAAVMESGENFGVYVEQSHIARHTDVMEVQGMTASPAAGGAFIHLAPDPHGGKTIWLSKWCDKEVLKDVLASTQIWETEVARGSRQITLPMPPTTALPATIRPPVADDLVLPFSADDASALAIVPLGNQGEDRHCWTRTVEAEKFRNEKSLET